MSVPIVSCRDRREGGVRGKEIVSASIEEAVCGVPLYGNAESRRTF